MRKFLILAAALLLLCPAAQAAETEEKYIALAFGEGLGDGYFRLLEELERRNANATFFLSTSHLEQAPGLAEEMLAGGHEIGLRCGSRGNMGAMSRRRIAGELAAARKLLPEGCKVRFLLPDGGECSDGARQVAEVTGLAILDCPVDPKKLAIRDTAAVGRALLEQVRDGDVVLLSSGTERDMNGALNLIDLLKNGGFTLLTVSELAEKQDVRIKPGAFYSSFPAGEVLFDRNCFRRYNTPR